MPESSTRSLRSTFIAASAVFIADAFILNQGVLAGIVGFVWLLLGLYALIFLKNPIQRSSKIRRSAVWVVTALSVFVINWANNRLARNRADHLVTAVKSYHLKYGKYPDSLEVLKHEYVSRVPLAKYTLTFNQFLYFRKDEQAFLFYVAVPPFGRATYSFQRNEWSFID